MCAVVLHSQSKECFPDVVKNRVVDEKDIFKRTSFGVAHSAGIVWWVAITHPPEIK